MYAKISAVSILVLGIYFCTSFNSVSATIMCYNCTYPNNTACKDPMGDVDMSTCPDKYACFKLKYHATDLDVTSRGCQPTTTLTCSNFNSSLTQQYGKNLTDFYCSTCTEDHCNSASSFEAPLIAMLVTMLAIKLMS